MYPTDDQWALFARYQDCPPPLHPRTFLQLWDLDYPQLAQLVGVSRDTVAHWFSTGSGSREVPLAHCRRLATIDFLWRQSDLLPQALLDKWCELTEDEAS